MSTAPQPLLDLNTLLIRAYVNNWNRHLWFKDATLQGNALIVPDETHQRFIESSWGAEFREHIPDLRIRVKSQEERLVTEKKQPVKKPIWNAKGREYHKQRLGGIE